MGTLHNSGSYTYPPAVWGSGSDVANQIPMHPNRKRSRLVWRERFGLLLFRISVGILAEQ